MQGAASCLDTSTTHGGRIGRTTLPARATLRRQLSAVIYARTTQAVRRFRFSRRAPRKARASAGCTESRCQRRYRALRAKITTVATCMDHRRRSRPDRVHHTHIHIHIHLRHHVHHLRRQCLRPHIPDMYFQRRLWRLPPWRRHCCTKHWRRTSSSHNHGLGSVTHGSTESTAAGRLAHRIQVPVLPPPQLVRRSEQATRQTTWSSDEEGHRVHAGV